MQKLLHSLSFWLVMFLIVAGLILWTQLSYLTQWYRLNPGYLDVMASAVVVVFILPFFFIAAFFVLRASTSDLPTYAQLWVVEVLKRLPRITFSAQVARKTVKG